MTYEVLVKNHNTSHAISADTFVNAKDGLIFLAGKDADNAPIAVAYFPAEDVEYVKEKK